MKNTDKYIEVFKVSKNYRGLVFTMVILLLILCMPAVAQDSTGELHVYPVGNLADIHAGSQEIEAIIRQVAISKKEAAIVFTGDITKSDLTDKVHREQDSIRLRKIIQQLQSAYLTSLVFIPGDRDWAYSGKKGWENVSILEDILESLPFDNVKWTPGHGCPGPKEVEIDDHLVLISINTQYWNHPYEKPSPTDAICKISSPEDFMEELDDILSEARNKNVLIAGHFPVISSGEYGGRMPLKKHLFPLTDILPGLWIPLPIAGSFYPAFRQNVGSHMDIVNATYEGFNAAVKNIIQDHPGLICISGHEYIQQLLNFQNSFVVNSGALQKISYTGKTKETVYAGRDQGLFRLEYSQNGDVSGTAFQLVQNELVKDKSMVLYHTACSQEDKLPINEYYAPCAANTIFPQMMSDPYDKPITAIAGEEYKASGLKKLLFGWHYRESWTTPIQTHFLNLDTTFGGLTPLKRGGGRQTTSLKFKAGNGCEYVFRSVNKDPKKALPYELRETIVADVVKDQTSTQQPYGALATRLMMEEIDILHPSPFLYMLPSDDKLGPFKEEFGNLLGMLEESPKSPTLSCAGFGGADEVIRSYKLFRKLYRSHAYRVNQSEFAKAKVFDILVGDWGRHEDNWKWAGYRQDGSTLYRPVPRDRDHVFSVWDGLLPWIADREWAKPSGDHFGYQVHDIRSLTWSARHLDRVVLTEVNKEEWLAQTALVKNKLTDDLIEKSIRNMPVELYEDSGKEIIAKLIARRENLEEYILDYYRLLAKYVDVLGTAKKELFLVNRMDDEAVNVRITNAKGNSEIYNRTFYPDETKEIRLYGLGNEDEFRINGESQKSILLRVIGGDGLDKITDDSHVKGARKMTLIYEKDQGSVINPGREAKKINSWNENVYDYNRQAFAYNTYFPLPYLGYNADDGFVFGFGIAFKRQRFGKEKFSAKHSFDLKGSTTGTLQFSYDGLLHQVIRKWDILFNGLVAYPTDFVNFYGFGNETEKNDSLFKNGYYKTRYNSIRLGTGLLREFYKRSLFSVVINYENNEDQLNDNTILDLTEEFPGKGRVNLFEGLAIIDLDFRNDKKFPEKGMRFYCEFLQGLITTNNNSSYRKLMGFVEFHTTMDSRFPLFIGLKGGGATSSGVIPFYKFINIGQNNFLRGYRKNRFTGKSMVFFNSELKLQILDIATPIVPVKFGLSGLYDIGRVYVDEDPSKKFHMGYGGGFYLIPLEKSFSLALNVAFSEEEKNGLVVFEFGISF